MVMRKISRRLNFCLLPKFDLKNLKNKTSFQKFSFVYGNIWNFFNLDLAVPQEGSIKPPFGNPSMLALLGGSRGGQTMTTNSNFISPIVDFFDCQKTENLQTHVLSGKRKKFGS